MRSNSFKSPLVRSTLAASVLLLASGASFAQTAPQPINLTAAPTTDTLPDGSVVPMWGYSCGTAVALSTATCKALNPAVAGAAAGSALAASWSPVVITIPYTTGIVNGVAGSTTTLTINLANHLTFTPMTPAGAVANTIPTSLTIVGQLGGGLGTPGTGCTGGATCTTSPTHASQVVTWSTVGSSPAFTPPSQGPRVQSFGTEVAATASSATTTTPLCFGNCTATQPGLNPGTYLIESGTHPSIQGPMGLYGILVVTNAPTSATAPGTAYPAYTPPTVNGVAGVLVPAVTYNAEVPLLFGEIDPVQNIAVNAAVSTAGFNELNVWSGQPGQCGNPLNANGSQNTTTYNTCYPPAVNYTPLYYSVNGVAFSRTSPTNSLFPATAGTATTGIPATGSVLVRMVNAGLHMHVPSIVGSQTTQTVLTTTPTATSTAVPGFSLIAEDGNRLPGVPHVQSDVFMAAGKTYDVMINVPATGSTAIPVYDRELSLSGNATERDAGMLAYIGVNGSTEPAAITAATATAAVAVADSYASIIPCTAVPCTPVVVSDPGKGVIANDTNVYGVTLMTSPAPSGGTVVLNHNGTFTFTPNVGATSGGFSYCANGSVSTTVACSSGISTTVSLTAAANDGTITVPNQTFTASTGTYINIRNPGLLTGATDAAGYPLTLNPSYTPTVTSGLTLVATDANGGFTATASNTAAGVACPAGSPVAAKCFTFTFQAKSARGTVQTGNSTATLIFPKGSGLVVHVLDGYDHKTAITDYRWVIEEDQTFFVDPNRTANTGGTTSTTVVPTFGVNFHTSHMPYVAQGCTGTLSCEGGQTAINPVDGTHPTVVCDVGNGACRTDSAGTGFTAVDPSQVVLDPTKRYYVSVLPGDAANPFGAGYAGTPDCTTTGHCGHGMGGTPIPAVACGPNAAGATVCTFAPMGATTAATCTPVSPATSCVPAMAVTALTQPSPYPTAKLSVFVFQDDFPLNGEHDSSGSATTASGNDTLAPNEPGLGGFQLHLWDAFGGNGDFTGQMTYDMFNMPLTNSLDGTIDPSTGLNACPITQAAAGMTGMIVTCPTYEADLQTLSPLAGQAVVANLMPGRWGVIATPGADRIARGEEWLQTNTLDGQKAHDSFTRIGEPSYFQEFGPASFHVSIGFANPAIINSRLAGVCAGTDINITGNCSPGNTLTGKVTGERLSRTPDQRLYSSTSHDAFAWTQCYVSVGDPDGEDFAFAKCNADGTFTLTGLPDGDWRITTFDQWNDALVDGLSTPVRLGNPTQFCPGSSSSQHFCNIGDIANTQWQTNVQTRTFVDDNADGISQSTETGIPFLFVAVRLRDGSLENQTLTDFTGTANFNETFPLFSWYAVESDATRYKNTGTHVVYDAGGPADGSLSTCGGTIPGAGYPTCGNSLIGHTLANTSEQVSLPSAPTNLRVPGSVYCTNADCTGFSINPAVSGGTNVSPTCTYTAGTYNPVTNPTGTMPAVNCSTPLSTGRIDNPWTGGVEGWQGFPGQFSFVEFGKEPYVQGENGGIKGHVIYASTRPFDDPQLLVQTQWEPLIPNVTINLYQEGFEADGVTPTLKLVDHTVTSSWDAWAQGFRSTGAPNMSCPGQSAADLFYFTLYNQPQYLDYYNNVQHGTATTPTALPYNSQFKCYDGMHNWNQLQPAPYDGMYKFPSVTAVDANGKPTLTGTNCTICTADPVAAPDLYSGVPMLPAGKYVVEVVPPQGFELVKEEDKNILIGDNFIAPATQQFTGLGSVFIVPDQASVAASQQYAGPGYNANNAQNSTNSFGTSPSNNIVPGFVPEPTWPCVGEKRIVPDYISLYPQTHQVSPFAGATRSLCDRKEVTLSDQTHAIAKFFLYTSTHVASKFTGGITDDYTSEFDPFSPQFGEKFAPPNLPVSIKDWTGQEISRVYADQWGAYNGMTYSTWEVNPPNPTGYAPTMMVMCMNDPGPILDARQTVVSSAGTTVANPTLGQLVTDPLFTQGYSQFCYEIPFMPAATAYLDTPVVPTSAFAGAGYNNPDCAYPALTPAIKEVDSQDGVGPWVSQAGHTLTITALGDYAVPNNAYNGPAATTAPYNQKTVVRHYGFGATAGTVTIGGVTAALTGTGWSDTSIQVAVPSGVPNCPVQQQASYGGKTAQCGELLITTAPATAGGTGIQSIDTVTVTIGGKTPTHIAASASIQAAIDAAAPGDLLIVDPTCNTATTSGVACSTTGVTAKAIAAHTELLLMWKPVRLQGVGAVSSVLNANTHPAGKMDGWRREVNCLFGLTINGYNLGTNNPAYDPSGQYSCTAGSVFGPTLNYFTGNKTIPQTTDGSVNSQVDRLAMEAVIGWDASQNGNLAELLQEPSLMGALEGAGITVLAKGIKYPAGASNTAGAGATAAGAFPTGTVMLSRADCTASNPEPSNFLCNPSSIDGLGITNASQGGGGIFVHGWGHNLQIANDRIYNNSGTLSGGINLGQGEFAPSNTIGGILTAPGSCDINTLGANALIPVSLATGQQEPYCSNLFVNVHHNAVMLNSSTGDELFSATPAGAGGVSFCTGADYYKFNYNWVCGNMSSGDGGGLGHLGYSWNGDIEHNKVIFNQSLNPTIPANGGGMVIMGAPDADPVCSVNNDADCVSPPGSIGPSDGVGPNLVINANLIQGNAAEAGSGGGIAFQNVNGSDVIAFPGHSANWHHVTVTNNIIVDNVAGWDGAGVSMLDALNLDFINNTVAANNTTATAGVLNNTLGAPLASTQNTSNNCSTGCGTVSRPQVAGVVSIQNSAVLSANIGLLPSTTPVVCPAGHYAGTSATNGSCKNFSYPLLASNILWQNAAFQVGVGALSAAYQQNIVTLYNAHFPASSTTHGSAITNQSTTGQCVSGSSYWDLGVRGDASPTPNSGGGIALNPTYSILTSTAGYGATNSATAPGFTTQYCDGARQPPESGLSGWDVPPGISDATVPNPIFNLTPVATVDEGNNWINLRWGPLSLVSPVANGATPAGSLLGNYAPLAANNLVPASTPHAGLDYFGNLRPEPGESSISGTIDAGAVEFGSAAATFGASVTGGPLTFSTPVSTTSAPQTLTLHNTGNVDLNNIVITFARTAGTGTFSRPTGTAGGTCSTTLAANAGGTTTCTINVVFTASTSTTTTSGTVSITGNQAGSPVAITGSPVGLTGNVATAVRTAAWTPNPYTFPNVSEGTGGPTQIFTLTNSGNVTMTGIGAATFTAGSAANFVKIAAGTTCGVTQLSLTAGSSCTVVVQFQGTGTAGAKAATLTITDSFGTQTDALTGTVATVTFAGPTPSLVTGTTTAHSGLITVSNAGAGSLTMTAAPAVTKVGAAGGTFSIIAGGCANGTVLLAGGSCTINVQYAPSGTTTATANVTITATGMGTPTNTLTSPNFTAN
jgi:hypothetical protein